MEKVLCDTCLSARTLLQCGLCKAPTCKTCSHFLDEDAFSFLPKVPEHLSLGTYCHACFEAKVAPELESYEDLMAAARQVDVYFKEQSKETRLIRREDISYVISECADREELVLRLAFLAASNGFTTLVDVEIVGIKVREHAYHKTVFRGSATPAKVRPNQVMKDRSIRHYPN